LWFELNFLEYDKSMFMKQDRLLDMLLRTLLAENSALQNAPIPADFSGKLGLLRTLSNIRPPRPIAPDILKIQDEILAAEREARGQINPYVLVTVGAQFQEFAFPLARKLALWKGDITTLAADAIVNAANSKLLGCFIPHHKCIDNAIHSAAGIQLRLECSEILKNQRHDEPTGQAKLTKAHNLPGKYIIHTVGPIIDDDEVTTEDARLLASCYKACLELADGFADIRTLAFCCISTGEFRFPKAEAARIAVKTVCDWVISNPDRFDRIIFNVFTQIDYDEYANLFRQS